MALKFTKTPTLGGKALHILKNSAAPATYIAEAELRITSTFVSNTHNYQLMFRVMTAVRVELKKNCIPKLGKTGTDGFKIKISHHFANNKNKSVTHCIASCVFPMSFFKIKK